MKHVVLGKKIQHKYSVDDRKVSVKENGETIKYFVGKPIVKNETEVTEYPEILRFEGELVKNSVFGSFYRFGKLPCFNISENEEVGIEKKVFRADQNIVYIYTDKICEETDIDKEEAETAHKNLLKEFNRTMIKSNPEMDRYCELHHLNYGMTDCLELFNYLFPDGKWKIINGKLVNIGDSYLSTSVVALDEKMYRHI